jgi:hypothetical protein
MALAGDVCGLEIGLPVANRGGGVSAEFANFSMMAVDLGEAERDAAQSQQRSVQVTRIALCGGEVAAQAWVLGTDFESASEVLEGSWRVPLTKLASEGVVGVGISILKP